MGRVVSTMCPPPHAGRWEALQLFGPPPITASAAAGRRPLVLVGAIQRVCIEPWWPSLTAQLALPLSFARRSAGRASADLLRLIFALPQLSNLVVSPCGPLWQRQGTLHFCVSGLCACILYMGPGASQGTP